jgi:hypothetical protein
VGGAVALAGSDLMGAVRECGRLESRFVGGNGDRGILMTSSVVEGLGVGWQGTGNGQWHDGATGHRLDHGRLLGSVRWRCGVRRRARGGG